MRIVDTGVIIALVVLAFHLLSVGANALIPFFVAVLVWFVIVTLARAIQHVRLWDRGLPHWAALVLAMIGIGVVMWFLLTMITNGIAQLAEQAPQYQDRLDALIDKVYHLAGIDRAPTLLQMLDRLNVMDLASQLSAPVASFTGNLGLFVVYVLFLFLEQQTFPQKMMAMMPQGSDPDRSRKLIARIDYDIRHYIGIMTLLGGAAAVLTWLLLLYFGIDFAALWAVLVFLLFYIPTFGAIAGAALPSLFSLVQTGDLSVFLIISMITAVIQIVMGNVVQPQLMSRSLNLSPIVIILSLVVWGQIWGVMGMFLATPLMLIINIILARFPQTRPVAVLLSKDGRVGEAMVDDAPR